MKKHVRTQKKKQEDINEETGENTEEETRGC